MKSNLFYGHIDFLVFRFWNSSITPCHILTFASVLDAVRGPSDSSVSILGNLRIRGGRWPPRGTRLELADLKLNTLVHRKT